MFLGNPVFPVSFELEQVTKLIEETLRKKSWQEFEVATLQLILTPFYVFYYDAAFEEEKGGKQVVKKTKRGRLALNAVTGELSKELAESMPNEKELVKELPDQYPAEVKGSEFSQEEAKKVAVIKTAEQLETTKDSIILSGFKTVYYPMWIASITVAGKNHQLEISAVTGQIFGEETVPERPKGFLEITRETLHELREPGAWLRYSREIVKTGTVKLGGRGKTQKKAWVSLFNLFKNPSFWLSVGLVIILIIVWVYS